MDICIRCPNCLGKKVVKYGRLPSGGRRYRCDNPGCPCGTFVLRHGHRGRDPGVRRRMAIMLLDGHGVREVSRVLKVSKDTVSKMKSKGSDYLRLTRIKGTDETAIHKR